MAGMTPEGLTILRQGEVLQELRTDAVPIFQDLVPADDVLDTSDSSTVGRLTGLLSIPLSDLWEAIQDVYLAFDPNSATGIALDNLVAYGGITRNPESPTTALVNLWGVPGLVLPALDTQVRSIDGNTYTLNSRLTFDESYCNGVVVDKPEAVTPDQEWSISFRVGNTSLQKTVIIESGDTPDSLMQELFTTILSYPWLNAEYTDNDDLRVVLTDYLGYMTVTTELFTITEIRHRAEVTCTESGPIEQSPNTITQIVTPYLGWSSVNNPEASTVGKLRETDEELRVRFRDSKFLRAQNIADSLYAALLEIDGVVSVALYENDTDVYDPIYDLPPHSFKVVILGGDSDQIAQAIWHNKPIGIGSEGNTTVEIIDSQQIPHDIHFTRPVSVPIEINMVIQASEGNTLGSTVQDQIVANLLSYFQSSVSVGDDVIYSRLYTPINQVPGFQVNSLQVGRDGIMGTSNVIIDYDEIASISSSDITITVTI